MKTLCLLTMVTVMVAASLGKVKGGEVIYVASIVEKTVNTFAVNPDSGALTKLASLKLPDSPGAMDLSPSGKHVYVVIYSSSRRWVFGSA